MIGVIGHFKHGELATNGQTSKTRNWTKEMRKRYSGEKFVIVDTSQWKRKPISTAIRCVMVCFRCSLVLIFPGENGLKAVLPICAGIKKFRKFHLIFPAVGGWLPEYLNENKRTLRYLRAVDKIYVETNEMILKLERIGLDRIERSPVFSEREGTEHPTRYDFSDEPIRLCTFSRVIPEKGIGLAINAVNELNRAAGRKKFILDIYGKLDLKYEQWLHTLMEQACHDAIHFRGILDDKAVISALKSYAALLFPTHYTGEGFPASIIESMLSSTPVIASNWRYNKELITDGYNGYLFELKDGTKGLIDKIKMLVSDAELANRMRVNCLNESQKYTPEKALHCVYQYIDSMERNKR